MQFLYFGQPILRTLRGSNAAESDLLTLFMCLEGANCFKKKRRKKAALTVLGFQSENTSSIENLWMCFYIQVKRRIQNEGQPCIISVSVLMEVE